MDTLEYRVEYEEDSLNIKYHSPVLWHGKTPQEVFRDQYSDRYALTPGAPPPKSTRSGVDYLPIYNVAPHKKENAAVAKEEHSRTYATLVPIPEKR